MSLVDVVLPDRFWEGVDANVQALLDAWMVSADATVEAGQPLARAVLVKTTLEIEAPVSGKMQGFLVAAGDNFARGQVLARIET